MCLHVNYISETLSYWLRYPSILSAKNLLENNFFGKCLKIHRKAPVLHPMKLVVLDLQHFFEGLCYKCFPLNLPEYFITAIM